MIPIHNLISARQTNGIQPESLHSLASKVKFASRWAIAWMRGKSEDFIGTHLPQLAACLGKSLRAYNPEALAILNKSLFALATLEANQSLKGDSKMERELLTASNSPFLKPFLRQCTGEMLRDPQKLQNELLAFFGSDDASKVLPQLNSERVTKAFNSVYSQSPSLQELRSRERGGSNQLLTLDQERAQIGKDLARMVYTINDRPIKAESINHEENGKKLEEALHLPETLSTDFKQTIFATMHQGVLAPLQYVFLRYGCALKSAETTSFKITHSPESKQMTVTVRYYKALPTDQEHINANMALAEKPDSRLAEHMRQGIFAQAEATLTFDLEKQTFTPHPLTYTVRSNYPIF